MNEVGFSTSESLDAAINELSFLCKECSSNIIITGYLLLISDFYKKYGFKI